MGNRLAQVHLQDKLVFGMFAGFPDADGAVVVIQVVIIASQGWGGTNTRNRNKRKGIGRLAERAAANSRVGGLIAAAIEGIVLKMKGYPGGIFPVPVKIANLGTIERNNIRPRTCTAYSTSPEHKSHYECFHQYPFGPLLAKCVLKTGTPSILG